MTIDPPAMTVREYANHVRGMTLKRARQVAAFIGKPAPDQPILDADQLRIRGKRIYKSRAVVSNLGERFDSTKLAGKKFGVAPSAVHWSVTHGTNCAGRRWRWA